jgi:K+-transporting ATPase ATPase A chain
MSELLPALGQIGALVVLLALTVPLLARYLATVYTSERHLGVERAAYRVLRVDPDADQHWRSYAMSVLGFSLVGILMPFGWATCTSTTTCGCTPPSCAASSRTTRPSPGTC